MEKNKYVSKPLNFKLKAFAFSIFIVISLLSTTIVSSHDFPMYLLTGPADCLHASYTNLVTNWDTN